MNTGQLLDRLHGGIVYSRRVKVLAESLAQWIPESATILDVGCGDGWISRRLMDIRPDISIQGIDVLVRPTTKIPVTSFDGSVIPFPDHSFDLVMFVDVLHHTDDPMVLLKEGQRVARQSILLKDHSRDGFLAGPTLRFMDWVGNARHGVRLPYNYWPAKRWEEAFATLGLKTEQYSQQIPLYPGWAAWAFTRRLHFVARVSVA